MSVPSPRGSISRIPFARHILRSLIRVGGRVRASIAGAVALVLVAAFLTVNPHPAQSAPPEASAQALQCAPLYTMQGTPGSGQNLWEIDPSSGAQTSRGTFGVPSNFGQINAMGMSSDGSSIYGVYTQNNNREIFRYDTNGNSSQRLTTGPSAAPITHGAVNPDSGIYYYGGFTGSSSDILSIYGFDPSTGRSLGLVAQGKVPTRGGNGDFAFSNTGQLYYIGANTNGASTLGVVDQELPTTSRTQPLPIDGTQLTGIPATAPINGIAFGGDGLLYMSSASNLYGADPVNGDVVSQQSFAQTGTTDMASCATPSTLQVQKDFSNGRFDSGDQVTLNIAGNGLEADAPGNTGVTHGSEDGVQNQQPSETAGPVLGRPGQTFEISETGAGASQTNYKSNFDCVNQRTGQSVVSGDGTTGNVTIPRGGADIVCTFVNEAQVPGLSLQKSAELQDENDNGVADAGETVDYSFTVTNTGNTTLNNVTIEDAFDFDDPGISPASVDGLEPEDSSKFTASYTVTQDDVDSGEDIVNTATAGGESPTGQKTTSAESKTNTPVAARAPGLSLQKTNELDDANGNNVADAGETINYSFTVTNTGNTTLTDVSIGDSLIDGTDPQTVASLAPGAEATFSGSYEVTQDDIDANGTNGDGVIRNTATASGSTPGQDDPVKSGESSTNTPLPAQNSSIGLKKTSELQDANDNNVADVDESIEYTFTVTNTGNTTLTDVSIADEFDFDGAGIDPSSIDSLAPGEDATFTAVHTVSQADVDAGGVIVNTATASGDDPAGEPVESDPSSTETPVAEPNSALSLQKDGILGEDSNGNGLADAGDTVDYTFTVTNDGNTTLSDITINDDRIDSTDPAQIASLAPGESAELTATYTVTQADIDDGGDIVNTATASGTAPNGPVESGEAKHNTPVAGQENAISLQKEGDLDDQNDNGTADPGESIAYTFTVTNTGNTTLTDVTVADDRIDAGTLDPESVSSLEPGGEATFTGSRQVTQTDLDAGEDIVNTATASGTPPSADEPIESTPATDNVPVTAQTNGLALQKTSEIDGGKTAAEVGDVIDFTFTVTNTGNTTLSDVSIADEFDFDSDIEPGSIEELAPGEQSSFTAKYTVTQADVDSGKDVTNTATADASAPSGEPVESNESTANTPVIPQSNGIAISKNAELDDSNGNGLADVGETIDYTFVVTNTGNTTLSDITVKDDRLDEGTLDPTSVDSLAPGDEATFTGSFTVTQKVIDDIREDSEPEIINTASAEGTPPGGDDPITSPEDTANVPLAPQAPGLHVDKSAELKGDGDAAKVGDTIEYTFVVTNTGNTTLTDIGIDDDRIDEVTLSDPSELPDGLAPGEKATFTGSYTVTQKDIDATDSTEIVNTATAHGTPPGGDEIPSGPSTANTPKEPRTAQIKLEKTGEIQGADAAEAGDTIEYTFKVTNTGNTTLSDVSIDDKKVGTVDPASVDTLAPGDSATFSASYTVTQADVDSGGVLNTATATGTTPDDSTVEAVDDDRQPVVSPEPAMELEKSNELQDENGNDSADAGETIDYTFEVVNTGNISLHDITINDDRIDEGSLSPESVDELAPGDSTTFTASYTVTQADVDKGGSIVNVATAQTQPEGDQPPVFSNEDSTKTPSAEHDSQLALEKSNELQDGNGNDKADVGEAIEYTFVVENTGNTTLTDVTVDDDRIEDGTLDPESVKTLAPGEKATFTASYTVTQADVDTGEPIKNTATAVGKGPGDGGDVRSPEDSTQTPVADTDAALSIEKTADKSILTVGETIEYSFVITNTGNVTVTDVGVSEEEFTGSGDLSEVSCPEEASELAPGDSVTCTATYEVTQADVDSGSLQNSATATGKTPSGDDPTSDPSKVTIPAPEPGPSLSIEKTADKSILAVGETIEYSFVITNTGDVTVSDAAVSEGEFTGSGDLSEVSCPEEASELAPGDSVTCTATYEVTQADVDSGSLENSATATGKTPSGDDLTSDPSEVTVPAPHDDSDTAAGADSDSSADADSSPEADSDSSADADAGGSDSADAAASSDADATSSSNADSTAAADSSADADGGGDLPRTGATGIMTMIAIALLMLAVGAVIVMAVRRRKRLG